MSGERDLREREAFLAGIPLFASLDETTRLELARQLEPVHMAAGKVIFRQGDTGEGLFLVVSGRLRVTVAADGAERVLYDVGRGAIVGELALLTDRPRAATIHAVRDSDLLLLRASSFRSVVERNPALLTGMTRLLTDLLLSVNRLLTADRPAPPSPGARSIAVACAGRNPRPAALVAERLPTRLETAGSVFRVDADTVARHLGPAAAQRGPGDPGRDELTGWLHAMERGHDTVIYQPDADDSAWSRPCLSQSDVVLLVAAAGDDPSVGAVEARALATGSLRCELALLHPAGSGEPSRTASLLTGRPVAEYHHLRAGRPGDVARLARMVTGTGCGLVLGGDGARGLAAVARGARQAGAARHPPAGLCGGGPAHRRRRAEQRGGGCHAPPHRCRHHRRGRPVA